MQELFVDKMYFLCYLPGMGKRMGRPKKPAGERRTEVLSFRVTKAELSKLNAAAKQSILQLKDWARNTVLRAAKVD
jgi:hypothetical protein